MALPTLIRTSKVGKYVSAVENVASTARIDNAMGWDWKCTEGLNGPCLTVPEKPSFSERHASNSATTTLQIGQHLERGERHLLAEPLSHNRYVYEGEQVVSI